jgi:drug/metabolite transporter (DMT)-like permease
MPAAASRHRDAPLRGIGLRVAAMLAFSVMGALMKLAGNEGVIAIEMLFYRGVMGLPVILLWIILGPGLASIRPARPWGHVVRSAVGITGITLNFSALILLPLADATTINFTAPIFATLLSVVLLREHVGPYRWAAVVVGFVGVIIVTRPGGGGSLPALGIAFAITGALFQAGVAIAVRSLGATETSAAIVFWFFFASIVIGGMGTAIWGSWHDPHVWALLAAGAVFGAVAQVMMTISLRLASVATLMPFDYLQIILALIFGWLLFDAHPAFSTLAGAALISSSGIYTAYREHRQRREAIAAAPTIP